MTLTLIPVGELMRPTVYRLYDANRRLLYVGQSSAFGSRLDSHRRSKWWPKVAFVALQHCAAEELARIEAAAIETENPLHNRAGRPRQLVLIPKKSWPYHRIYDQAMEGLV